MAQPKRCRLLLVLFFMLSIVVAGSLVANRYSQHALRIQAQNALATHDLSALMTEQAAMESEVNRKDTDEYFIEMARSLYGLIRKNEYRVKVINPEALTDNPVSQP